ncbi:MAG TPA: AI-2E family transporter [Bryobacteraceae bacterium]|nr:AI-2E family transporter [Bryobacteraceae bacterium]
MPRLATAPQPRNPTPLPDQERPPFWWIRWVPTVIFFLVVIYVAYIVGRVAVVPVLASAALAYVLNPIVEVFERRGFSRLWAATLALLIVSLAVCGFLWFVVPDLWEQSVKASEGIMGAFTETNAQNARAYIRSVSPLLDRIIGYRVYRFLRSPNSLIEASQSWAAGSLTDFLVTASSLLDLLLIPFFVFYILVDFSRWRDRGEDLIPPRFREPFSRLFDEVGRILQSYVLGQLMIAIIMGILYAIGFAAMQVPAWAGIAALSGFLNVIPYVGTGFGIVVASGFTLAHTGEIWRVFGVLGVFTAVQCVEGYYLTPKILGGRLSLHPMAVFLGLLIGGKLFGFLGVLLAVPAIAVAQVFFKFLREIYKTSDFYRAGEMGPEPAPAPVEEVIAKAADTVLADQVDKQKGDEVLAPDVDDDDRVAREKLA